MDQQTPQYADIPQRMEQYGHHYDGDKFWDKLKTAAQSTGAAVVYTALLLYHVMRSPQTSLADKAIVTGALGYFILPVDLIADILPGIGFTDDAAAMTAALITVANNITPEVERQAKEQLCKWFNNVPDEVLDNVVSAIRTGSKIGRHK